MSRWITIDTARPLASLATALGLDEGGSLSKAELARRLGVAQPNVPNALKDERDAIAAGRVPRTAAATLFAWAEEGGFELEIRVRKKSSEP